MREALVHSLTGLASLEEDDYRERPVDRLHALASAQGGTTSGEIEVGGRIHRWNAQRTAREAHLAALGKSWIALRDAFRTDELGTVLERLMICLMWNKPAPSTVTAEKVARWIIIERIHENCPTCKGRKEIPDTERMAGREFVEGDGAVPMRICPECHGTGRHIYSEAERIEGLGIDPKDYRHYGRFLDAGEMWLNHAESRAIQTAKKLLEKWR